MQHTHPQGEEAWSRNTKEEKTISRLYLVTVQELCWKQVSLTPRLPTNGLRQALLPEHQIPVTSQCITSQLSQPKPTNEGGGVEDIFEQATCPKELALLKLSHIASN